MTSVPNRCWPRARGDAWRSNRCWEISPCLEYFGFVSLSSSGWATICCSTFDPVPLNDTCSSNSLVWRWTLWDLRYSPGDPQCDIFSLIRGVTNIGYIIAPTADPVNDLSQVVNSGVQKRFEKLNPRPNECFGVFGFIVVPLGEAQSAVLCLTPWPLMASRDETAMRGGERFYTWNNCLITHLVCNFQLYLKCHSHSLFLRCTSNVRRFWYISYHHGQTAVDISCMFLSKVVASQGLQLCVASSSK